MFLNLLPKVIPKEDASAQRSLSTSVPVKAPAQSYSSSVSSSMSTSLSPSSSSISVSPGETSSFDHTLSNPINFERKRNAYGSTSPRKSPGSYLTYCDTGLHD